MVIFLPLRRRPGDPGVSGLAGVGGAGPLALLTGAGAGVVTGAGTATAGFGSPTAGVGSASGTAVLGRR